MIGWREKPNLPGGASFLLTSCLLLLFYGLNFYSLTYCAIPGFSVPFVTSDAEWDNTCGPRRLRNGSYHI